ncbi:MAG: SPOR domain-containing protein [Prolixibacteraceae bacterium]|nr:SPOR domain-containing protein [Prolixibacteraceae bacterium]
MKKLLIVLLSLFVIVSCKTTKKAVEETEPVIEPVVEVIEEPVVEEPVIEVVEEPIVEEPIIVKEEEVEVIEEEKPPVKPTFDFFVIIGSFKNSDNAGQFKTKMAEKGFYPVLLSTDSGFIRVAVDQTNSEADARSFIKNIRAKYAEHKDVWLLKKK